MEALRCLLVAVAVGRARSVSECPALPSLPTLASPGSCAACVPPMLNVSESCMYDMSSCGAVAPGSSCEVRCLPPFSGPSSTGRCVGTNKDKGTPILWSRPACMCPEPPAQQGYMKSPSTGLWQCADDYRGRPRVVCNTTLGANSVCTVTSWLMGCDPLVPCARPLVDPCRFDTTGCESVAPGATCQVRCKAPLIGGVSVATCPAHNTVVGRPLDYRPVRCTLQVCPDPNPWPAGYNKTAQGNWTCASGYFGVAVNKCLPGPSWSKDCAAVAGLEGCLEMVPCQSPQVTGKDACMYDVSGCQNVAPGAGCEVRCKNPFSGTYTQASCDANNTDPNGLRWTPPVCKLVDCDDPGTIPAGFLKTITGWQCAQSYSGFAVKLCEGTDDCQVQPKLTGCAQLVPCVAPKADCRYDMYDCANVLPGGRCTVRCKAPFVGTPTSATCLAGNTNISGLQWTPPECEVGDCGDPWPWPMGYKKGLAGWQCASGFAGVVNKSCVWVEATCTFEAVLSGCRPEAPCAPLTVTDQSSCMYNVSLCSRVPSGRSCQVTCMAPFFGRPSMAVCPAGNTDPANQLVWTPPQCDCLDPSPLPEEYNRTVVGASGNLGLQCARGYAGSPHKVCNVNRECVVTPILAGCSMPVACEVSPFEDLGSRGGRVTGHLNFGRAMVLGSVNEVNVTEYKAYFANNCLQPVGEPVGVLTRHASEEACCRGNSYVLPITNLPLPATATGLIVMVSTTNGDAPNGKYVPLNSELITRQVTAGARRGAPLAAAAFWTLAVATEGTIIRAR